MFHVDRATAVSAFFLEKAGGRMNDIKLAKLQYIAEHASITRNLQPLTGARGVSLNHGPCVSEAVSLTNDTDADPLWDHYIGFEPHSAGRDNEAILLKPFNISAVLSEDDVALLNKVWAQHGHVPKWHLRQWCHDVFPEYVEVGPGGSKPITLEAMFEGTGLSKQEAQQRADDIRYFDRFEAVYGHKEPQAS